MLQRFENTVCPVNTDFIMQDRFTFAVLARILRGECALTLVDGERLVICHSATPYPVWIWTADDATETEMENAYRLAKENLGFTIHRFNVKHSLADYFISRAKEDGVTLMPSLRMLAYSCPSPIAPKRSAVGFPEKATAEDTAEVARLMLDFHLETGVDRQDLSECTEKAHELIEKGCFYFWNNGCERVATCSCRESGEDCNVGAVYTKPEHRRKGYAAALVYEVSQAIVATKKTPILYTDADYAASNACYTQIGYQPHGGLCTIEKCATRANE